MARRVFKRKIYQKMLQWKQDSEGKTALLVEGARRVGKSTIVEDFAHKEYASYLLVDFNKASATVKSLFDDLMDLDFIFLQLQAIYHVQLKERKSVIIFDEVQKCPNARQAIKYLVQDGRYDYIETGSLISIRQNTKDITIPSEETRIEMHPMDLEEFYWALGDEVSVPLIRTFFEKRQALGAAHRTKQRDLRLYMLVGGMPQAVNEYIETNNMSKVDAVKRNIIRLYTEDFLKIDPSGKTSKIFMSIPSQLSRGTSRYYHHPVVGSLTEERKDNMLIDLEESKTVQISYHANDPNVGMSLTRNTDCYKLYVADTGLFITMAFWDKDFTENIIYQKLLSDKLETNLGYIYENLVAQMLVASGNKLFYYTFPKDEKHSYEIDFLISRDNKICPIEVKSSGYKAHVSLDEFFAKYHSRIKCSYLLYTKDYQTDKNVNLLPVYMTMLI